jgi:hypothetical protein
MGKAKRKREKQRWKEQARERRSARRIEKRKQEEIRRAEEEERQELLDRQAEYETAAKEAARVCERKMRDARIAAMTPEQREARRRTDSIMAPRGISGITVHWQRFPIVKTLLPQIPRRYL